MQDLIMQAILSHVVLFALCSPEGDAGAKGLEPQGKKQIRHLHLW
jgi:hypothetical protein